jgi:hypothetical protein
MKWLAAITASLNAVHQAVLVPIWQRESRVVGHGHTAGVA